MAETATFPTICEGTRALRPEDRRTICGPGVRVEQRVHRHGRQFRHVIPSYRKRSAQTASARDGLALGAPAPPGGNIRRGGRRQHSVRQVWRDVWRFLGAVVLKTRWL